MIIGMKNTKKKFGVMVANNNKEEYGRLSRY